MPFPGFFLLGVLSFPPFFLALYLSFVNLDLDVPHRPLIFVGLKNYKTVLLGIAGLHALAVTIMVAFGGTVLAVVAGYVIASLIHHYAGRFTALATILMVIPFAVSPVAMAVIFSLILNPLYGPVPEVVSALGGPLISVTGSPAGALLAVVLVQVWQWSPLAVVLILGGLRNLPNEPLEAAALDGAGGWQMTWHVRLPLLRPILAVAAIFEFILCSQVFAATELLTDGGPGSATVDLSLYIYKIGISESGQVSVAAAAGIVTLVLGLASAVLWLKAARWDTTLYR